MDEARQEFDEAYQLDPHYPAPLYNLGILEWKARHQARSTDLFRKVLALDPSSADAQYMLGRNLSEMGDPAQALEHWQLALKLDPNNSKALYALGRALTKSGDPEGRTYLDRFDSLEKQKLVSERVMRLGNFGLDAANALKWSDAISNFQEAIKICGDCPQKESLHKNLGIIYSREGNAAEAESELHQALKLNPRDADALRALDLLGKLPARPESSN